MKYTVRPLSDRTWLRPDGKREASRFDSTWTATQTLLDREVTALGGKNLVIEVDVPERGIRNDGMLRADARAESPAAVVAFESKHGPQLHQCDKFISRWHEQGPDWQQNVRAIALTLEALRAVGRYGAAETGQQYTGFKAIGAGRAMPASHMTTDQACRILSDHSGVVITSGESMQSVRARHRAARAAVHPDRHGGDRTLWDQVEQAATVLGVDR
ncbi:MAG: molecular chaperone DnaJ [Actinobacteria bacterium]|nr:molecular chaperone DnaJ [Actinomycetota bacterium]